VLGEALAEAAGQRSSGRCRRAPPCRNGTPETGMAAARRLVPDGSSSKRNVGDKGLHILRHTFCSHLAMRGAPDKAIQGLAGQADLTTTPRYMHLSPAARDSSIRLVDTRPTLGRGDVGETGASPSRIAVEH